MKKSNIIFIAVILLITTFSTNKATAQDGKILVGAGLKYASKISSVGISIKGDYLIDETWEAGASFTYFLESDYTSWSSLDLDAHYVISKEDKITLYGLGGLNFTFWKFDMNTGGLFGGMGELSGSEVGLNIGAGGRYVLTDKISLNGEAKYTIGGFNFFTMGIGAVYSF